MASPERIACVASQLSLTPDAVSSLLSNAKRDPTLPTDPTNIPSFVDFTVLTAFATSSDIISLCTKAKQYRTISVCVNPNRVALCKSQLAGSPLRIAAVVGFPLGATTSSVKAIEAAAAVSAGADEIDMVIDVGALLENNYQKVLADIREIVAACPNSYVKCIIETCYLTEDKIVDASILTVVGGADCVKTSTGFGKAGAVAEHVKLMRAVVGPNFGVKAAGGVRTKEAAQEMIAAGASRIGASSPALFE
jgi:deoxyribose-phosphate aldolase